MQTLYSMDSAQLPTDLKEAQQNLTKKIEQSRLLYTYLIYFLTEVARYAETDARNRASKHLPTAEDLHINTRIAGNELLWKIREDASFRQTVSDGKLESQLDTGLVRKIYTELTESDEYREYIEMASRDKKSEKKILEHIFTQLMLPNEEFTNHVEELFVNWDDDAEMMYTLVQNYLGKPGQYNFHEMLSAEKRDFAQNLLRTVIEKADHTLELIKPKLKNWDADRIAALDLIILQMGVCEFLYFETIPTKVTINEYIDIAKAYSTVQSGQFVNGLLDNIHKELTAENKIHKKQFKNSTL